MGKDLNGKELGVGIGQAKDKRYYARYTNRYGERSSPFYSFNLKEVKDWLAIQRYDDKLGKTQIFHDNATVGDVYRIWIKEKAKDVRPQTLNFIQGRYANHIQTYEHYNIKDITREFADNFISEMVDKKLCLGTIKLVKGDFSQMMEYAMDKRICANNPFKQCKMPKTVVDKATKHRREIKENKFLTEEQQEIFLNYINNAAKCKYKHLYKLLLFTGLRISEAMALKWEHVNLSKKFIYIQDNHVRYKDVKGVVHTVYDAPTKNDFSSAKIPLSDKAVDFFVELQAERNNVVSGFVFLNKKGEPLSYSSVNKELKSIVKALNKINPPDKHLPPITPHYFRHTYAENCIEKGIPLTAVQYFMRHAQLTTTANAYGHASYDIAKTAMDKLNTQN